MTGVVEAGFVLAVLPLMISACEDYKSCFRPFVTYARFAKEARRFQIKLETQKVTFKNEVRLLLLSFFDHDEVDNMLENPDSPTWVDHGTNRLYEKHLSYNYKTVRGIIELISETLRTVGAEAQLIADGLIARPEADFVGDKAWRHRVRAKWKLAFSKSQLESKIVELRCLNGDLARISKQMTRMQATEGNRVNSSLVRETDKQLARFRAIRKASQHLYEGLAQTVSCSAHTEHRANLCLDAEADKLRDITSRIRFDMAFSYMPCLQGPIWLAVESAIEPADFRDASSIQPPPTNFSGLWTTLKREACSEDEEPIPESKSKSVKFQLNDSHSDGPTRVVSCVSATTASTTSKNFHSSLPVHASAPQNLPELNIVNFCLHIQRQLHQPSHVNTCMGVLNNRSCCKQLVYRTSPASSVTNQASSLASILSHTASGITLGLEAAERIRLARSLANAVLKFRKTRWLQDTWRSADVLFFNNVNNAPARRQNGFGAPHLSVRFLQNDGMIEDFPKHLDRHDSDKLSIETQNKVLFSLGVVLLELGFEKPIESLQSSEDLQDGKSFKYTERLCAERLSHQVHSKLGRDYARIVRKCLRCDFGVGEIDLNIKELQDAFYRDVICELDILEAKFRALGL